MKLSIVIPVYKNKKLFLRNLLHNIRFLPDSTIIVVNDDPDEEIEKDVKQISKDIIVLQNSENLGFAKSVNIGVRNCKTKYVMLLNSDVLLHDDTYLHVISTLEKDEAIFAIGFMQEEQNNNLVGRNKLYLNRGLIKHEAVKQLNSSQTAWAEGGACIVRKEFYDNLGGFDDLYSPFYWEDIDLSYRAMKHGWKILIDESVKVQHFHESTIGKYFDRDFISKIAYRNQFIFFWKNVHDYKLVLYHLLLLPYNIFWFSLKGERNFLLGFFEATLILPRILKKRSEVKRNSIVTDSDVLAGLRTL